VSSPLGQALAIPSRTNQRTYAIGAGSMAVSLADNLIEVRKRLKKAARKAGRDLSEITLIAVTKNIEPRLIRKAVKEGLRVFGESYIQEAQEKIKKIGRKQKQWHFIGHLQKNKARFAVDLFDCIHSVDTPGLARELNRRATHPIDVLIQVNISGEKSKHGATPEGAVEIARLMPGLKNLNFRGLMAIPPPVDPPERARPYFITLRRLAERINRERIPGVVVHDLSMGMSADFDIAIEEGATMVRVGTAIFGPREVEKKTTKKAAKKAVKPALERGTTATAKKKAGVASKKTKDGSKASVKTRKAPAAAKKTAKRVKKAVTPEKASPKVGKKAAGSGKVAKAATRKTATAKKTSKTRSGSAAASKAASKPSAAKKTTTAKKATTKRKTATTKTSSSGRGKKASTPSSKAAPQKPKKTSTTRKKTSRKK